MENIKNYQKKELRWFIIGQIFTIIIFQNPKILSFNFSGEQIIMAQIVTSTVFSSLIGVYSFVLDAVFSDELKLKLLYLRKGQPGERIFSEIRCNHKDFRYTKEKAVEQYKDIYINMPDSKQEKRAYENAQWYKIYRKHRTEDMIYSSHRESLLCRDIYFATIVIIILYVLVSLLFVEVEISWKLLTFESLLLIVSNVAARQSAKRVVDNVIASDLQEPLTYEGL